MPPLRPDTPVKFLKGVGERRADAFARLGVHTAQDLLWHIPFRYLDVSSLTPLARARVGEEVACVGRVIAKRLMPTRSGLRIFTAVLRDDSGMLECAWPGQGFLDRSIEVGQTLLVAGQVRFYHGRQLNPREYIILADAGSDGEGPAPGRVLPVYRATEGLSHKVIRGLIDRHLDQLVAFSRDPLPESVPSGLGLPPLSAALRAVHRPGSVEEAEVGAPPTRLRRTARSAADAGPGSAARQARAERGPLRGAPHLHPPPGGKPAVAAHHGPEAGHSRDHRGHDRGGADAPAAHG